MLPRRLDTTIAYKVIGLMKELSGTDRRFAIAIIEHFNRKTGRCDPGIARIASLIGSDRRQVHRSTTKLGALGILTKFRRGGSSRTNKYQPNWDYFRQRDANWQQRFIGAEKHSVAESSPSQCPKSHFAGDNAVTQTCLHNQSSEPSSQEVLAIRSDRSFSGQRKRSQTRTAAERQWTSDLHNHFVSDPIQYGEIIEKIDSTLQSLATEAEIIERGAGIRFVLDHLQGLHEEPRVIQMWRRACHGHLRRILHSQVAVRHALIP